MGGLDLGFWIIGVEVEMQPVLAHASLGTFCSETLTLLPLGSRRATQSGSGGSRGTKRSASCQKADIVPKSLQSIPTEPILKAIPSIPNSTRIEALSKDLAETGPGGTALMWNEASAL